jgi:predicted AAA+ superfamily ATPase
VTDKLLLELASLSIYINITEDTAVKKLAELIRLLNGESATPEETVKVYCGIYAHLLRNGCSNFYQHVENLTLRDENIFTLSCEKGRININDPIAKQADVELRILKKLAEVSCAEIKEKIREKFSGNTLVKQITDGLPDWNSIAEDSPNAGWSAEERISWHRKNGAGIFCSHYFFIYDGATQNFVPVKNPDPITLDRLYFVENQKRLAVKNTRIFLAGRTANNILFYGDRGTGKSSMVKAIANEFCRDGLRLVEIPKRYLEHMPKITSMLSGRGLKFILFIDDLAFDSAESEYTALKAVLEGGIEHRPDNILLYATTNRRHIVKEKFSEREGLYSDNSDDEIRARDAIQEKLSLADRFGITIVFTSPAKKEYLQIVHKMAEESDIKIDPALLEQKAMQWELAYNGMSPRTARQFIDWLKGEMELELD